MLVIHIGPPPNTSNLHAVLSVRLDVQEMSFDIPMPRTVGNPSTSKLAANQGQEYAAAQRSSVEWQTNRLMRRCR